jgi:hypothetical protein
LKNIKITDDYREPPEELSQEVRNSGIGS